MNKTCPHCGASLPEEASFCPNCARSVNERVEPKPPRRIPARPLGFALLALAAAVAVLLAVLLVRGQPKVYDNGSAEVIYTSRETDYQLCIAWADTPFTAVHKRYANVPLEESSRYIVILYANRAGAETHAGEEFLELVDTMTAQVDGLTQDLQMTCTQPEHNTDYIPNSAAVVYIDYRATALEQQSADLTVSIRMKNGDVIRLHQTQIINVYTTHDYTTEDAPMDTVADLEALLKQIEETLDPADPVNIHLPPVTYTEEFTVAGRPVNFIGSEDGTGTRTTFAAPVQVSMQTGTLVIWENIDFIGPGAGTGMSVSARVHLNNCRVAGWETGVLAHTNAWFNTDKSVFENNTVGLHFNAQSGSPSDSQFADDVFQGNGTAVLLEQVPNKLTLKFPGTRFEGNGQDIDNRCDQPLDLSTAVFK